MGGIRFRLGAFVVQVQALEVELADQALQLLVVIVFSAGCIQFQVTGVSLHGSGGFFEKYQCNPFWLLLIITLYSANVSYDILLELTLFCQFPHQQCGAGTGQAHIGVLADQAFLGGELDDQVVIQPPVQGAGVRPEAPPTLSRSAPP